MTLMTASEARCRVENAKAIKELEGIIEYAVNQAIEHGDYKVSVSVPRKVMDEGLDIVNKEIEKLGYEIAIEHLDDAARVITLRW
ncbi:MAG: hypothetical protein IKN54_09190 [Lachnospiraceae bacterium]|nr:hypothetical protein [Lachnospiraceae bacterium]